MEKEGLFEKSERRRLMKIRTPVNEEDIIPNVICEGKQVTEFEPDFLIVSISHGGAKDNKFNILKRSEFPVENRSQ